MNLQPIPFTAANTHASAVADLRAPSSWAAQWLVDVPGLAPAVARLVGENRETTAQALHQAAAAVLVRIACLSQGAAGVARLRGMLRLPGADASAVPDLGLVLDDERESETLMRAGAEALAGLFGAHCIAPLAAAIADTAKLRHRAVAAHVLELVAAIALARINAVAKERRLDTQALMALLGETRAETSRALAPAIAKAVGDERGVPASDRVLSDAASIAFDAPPRPSTVERLVAWGLLGVVLSGVAYAAFVL